MVHKSLNSSSNSPNSQIPWEFNDLEFAVLKLALVLGFLSGILWKGERCRRHCKALE